MTEQASHLNVTEQHGVSIVAFSDRKILEELSIREIEEELALLVDSKETINLLLNFGNVEHLSSAALGMLIKLNEQVSKRSGRLKLSDIRPQIFQVFKITRLNKLFDIHDSAAEAMNAFSKSA